ncbi:MAG: ABC transporter permease [Chloroflexota bacterium]
MIATIAAVTVRALLSRRRAVLMALLAAVPVLVGLLARIRGRPGDAVEQVANMLEPSVVATLLPLIALVFGTAALGAELDDGSAIHLLTKPIARWRIVVAKILAAAPVTALLAGGATLLTGLLIGGDRGAAGVTLVYTLAVVVGAIVYVTLFVALSVLTSRALIVGLAYVAVWEGMLAGLFEGTKVLSVRQYVVGIVAALDPAGSVAPSAPLSPATAVVGVLAVAVVAFLVAVRRLERHQLSAGD